MAALPGGLRAAQIGVPVKRLQAAAELCVDQAVVIQLHIACERAFSILSLIMPPIEQLDAARFLLLLLLGKVVLHALVKPLSPGPVSRLPAEDPLVLQDVRREILRLIRCDLCKVVVAARDVAIGPDDMSLQISVVKICRHILDQ